ncbi:MAG: hypothetical protein QM705_01730 [Ancrocorticia sp.]
MRPRLSLALLCVSLLLAAVAAAVSTWLVWLPCQGSMLNGFLGLREASGFSDACLARMDGSATAPLVAGVAEAKALSVILLGLGWWGYASHLRFAKLPRAVVLSPILPIGWFAGQTWLSASAGTLWETTTAMGMISLTCLLAGVVLLLHPADNRTRYVGLIGLWGVASYGVLHFASDYMLMIGFSAANWDVPPGTGYLSAAGMIVCALLVAILGWRATRPQSPEIRATPTTSVRVPVTAANR